MRYLNCFFMAIVLSFSNIGCTDSGFETDVDRIVKSLVNSEELVKINAKLDTHEEMLKINTEMVKKIKEQLIKDEVVKDEEIFKEVDQNEEVDFDEFFESDLKKN